jgi:hypothetical protein
MAPAAAPRSYHFATWTGTEMLVFGGVGGDKHPLGYDPVTNVWTTHAPMPAGASGYPVWTGKQMVIVPTDPSVSSATFDPVTDTWTKIAAVLPLQKRSSYAFTTYASTTNEAIVWGGYVNGVPFEFSDGAALNLTTGMWRVLAASPAAPRDGYDPPAVGWNGKEVVMYGGGTLHGDRYQDAFSYDPKLDVWTALSQAPCSGYTNMGAAVVGPAHDRVVFWGGDLFGGVNANYPAKDGALWDGTKWTLIPGMPSGGGFDGHPDGVTWGTDTGFGVWGGRKYNNGFSPDDTGSIYDQASGKWTDLPPGGPSGRSHSSAVWTGKEVIIWGGEVNNQGFADGKIYRP